MSEPKQIDVLIAGQGAAAFAAGLYSSRYQVNTLIASEQFGGETAIGGTIENYPGQPDIDGFDLMMKFKEQVDNLETPTVYSDLKSVTRNGDVFRAVLDDGTEIDAISVILAVGRERRKLGLPKEQEWTGKGVSYCSTCDAPLYRNKPAAAVVGGGNAAVEGAILLAKYAATVYLIYRRDEFTRPEPILVKILEQTENVKVLYSTEVTELLGSDETGLTGIRLSKPWDGQDELTIDGLFVEAGADPRLEIPNQLGLEINPETGEVHINRASNTSVKGIYAAGDLTDGTNLKQTITAASQGAIAALSAYQHVLEVKSSRQDARVVEPADTSVISGG
ncbi:MAG: FAD-dependent oxidoreductase [Chloroflexi bacterium]|nr:FAD-dependent oxidoreductase [Chloroflexota bacterium]MCH8114764.1 FAD-dependent oxidoreductase [Chloroflexota bacterium]MCI0871333.1 FAD-dependent oxidoreductase [Chloroflexota bacterium]MCI0873873.1 FAD-dependent oxidoreductase [Chloroflexota bacterium]MCI0881497.1 FAD-dependent oxidoreductase [Chloroflexota bacterium]